MYFLRVNFKSQYALLISIAKNAIDAKKVCKIIDVTHFGKRRHKTAPIVSLTGSLTPIEQASKLEVNQKISLQTINTVLL